MTSLDEKTKSKPPRRGSLLRIKHDACFKKHYSSSLNVIYAILALFNIKYRLKINA